MKYLPFSFIFLGILMLAACTQAPDYPNIPEITYKGANKKIVNQGSNTAPADTLQFAFTFTDGDGDIKDGKIHIYDSRDTSINIPGNLTLLPDEDFGAGISGEVIVNVPNKTSDSPLCCIIDYGEFKLPCAVDPRFPQDTFSYFIQLEDRAGNKSNLIRTETFTILCR